MELSQKDLRKGYHCDLAKFLVLNLCITCILVTGSLVCFHVKTSRVEESLSNLARDVTFMRLRSESWDKAIGKRSSRESASVEQHLIANASRGGLQVAQLFGAGSVQHITKNGRIGPWLLSGDATDLVTMTGGNTEVQINLNGLYFLYAQISYITSDTSNSFEMRMLRGSQDRTLTTCSSQANAEETRNGVSRTVHDVSCYTGTVSALRENDRIFLNQVEQNRYINFQDGFSHFGIIRINE